MSEEPHYQRLSSSEVARRLLDAQTRDASRAYRSGATFGVTEDRGPGGSVIPLLRVEIPVGEEWTTGEEAFTALLEYVRRWRQMVAELELELRPATVPALVEPKSGGKRAE